MEEKERMPGQLSEEVLESLLDTAVTAESHEVGLQVMINIEYNNSYHIILMRTRIPNSDLKFHSSLNSCYI